MKPKIILAALFLALTTMGSSCINDGFLVVVNIEKISGEYTINPGTNVAFGPPVDCTTISARDYLSSDFTRYRAVRIYDIRISTIGSFPGNVLNGRVMFLRSPGNYVELLRYTGPWNSFNTPQSLLTSPLIDRSSLNAVSVGLLVNAITNGSDITICGAGSLSQAVTQSGLKVKIEVLAQVDAEVD